MFIKKPRALEGLPSTSGWTQGGLRLVLGRTPFSSILLTVLFAWFAFVQLDDPDPLRWFAVHGFVAVMCGMAVFQKFSVPIILAAMPVILAWSLCLSRTVYEWAAHHPTSEILFGRVEERPYIEEPRESLGLLIAFLGLLYQYFNARRSAAS